MRLQHLHGSVGILRGQGDVLEVLPVSAVGEVAAHAAIKIIPRYGVLLHGSHDDKSLTEFVEVRVVLVSHSIFLSNLYPYVYI